MPLADRMSSQLLGELSGDMQKESSREVFQRSNAFGKWGPLGENVGVSSPPGRMSLKALLLATSSETLRAQHRLQLTIGTGVGTEAAKGTYAHPQQRAGTLLSQPQASQRLSKVCLTWSLPPSPTSPGYGPTPGDARRS